MKGSKFLSIGGLVVAGVIAHKIYRYFCSKKNNCQENIPCPDTDFCSKESSDPMTNSYVAPTSNVCETKETVVASVKERHYEAAKAMEESLNTIFKENNDETIVSENSNTFSKTSNDLNELLK